MGIFSTVSKQTSLSLNPKNLLVPQFHPDGQNNATRCFFERAQIPVLFIQLNLHIILLNSLSHGIVN